MLIIGIDPGITGAICFFENGELRDVIDMPTMASGNKNKSETFRQHQLAVRDDREPIIEAIESIPAIRESKNYKDIEERTKEINEAINDTSMTADTKQTKINALQESRKNLLHLAEMRKKTVDEEVRKLSDIDEVKARILGLGEDEI